MKPYLRKSIVIRILSLLLVVVLGATAFAALDPSILDQKVSNELSMNFNITKKKSSTTPSGPTQQEITVVVDSGGDGAEVSKSTIIRTVHEDGNVTDEVTFKPEQAKETVTNLNDSGTSTARIYIPDPEDRVSQLDLKLPKESMEELADGGLDLEIYTDNAKIIIPNQSLINLSDDVFFRVIPIKDEDERLEVEERARIEQVVKEIADGQNVNVVARPMTIETNLSSRAVSIELPLLNVKLPEDEEERNTFLADLVIFIEHSDGERKLVKPTVVEYKNGQLGLRFDIQKFSTFTILNMEGWGQYIAALEEGGEHSAYLFGYPDQQFKPDRGISRAEMAALLYRIDAGSALQKTSAKSFTDVSTTHWANKAIEYVSAHRLMVGFSDQTFKPNQQVSRAEIAVIVSQWLKLEGSATASFTDTRGHWAEKSIALVQEAGKIKGFIDGTYKPNQALTRAEIVTLINNILNRGSADWSQPSWSDVPTTHWAFKHIEEATQSHSFHRDVDGTEKIQFDKK